MHYCYVTHYIQEGERTCRGLCTLLSRECYSEEEHVWLPFGFCGRLEQLWMVVVDEESGQPMNDKLKSANNRSIWMGEKEHHQGGQRGGNVGGCAVL